MCLTKPFKCNCFIKQHSDEFFECVCINLSICAQGNSIDDVKKKIKKSIIVYLSFVIEMYPERWNEYVPRHASQNFIEEYNKITEDDPNKTFSINITNNDLH